MLLKLLLTALLLSVPALAQATNYFISPSGSDSANGTSASTPWLTFAKAFGGTGMAGSPAGAGHTLNLADGVYGVGTTGQIALSGKTYTSGSPLTIRCVNSRQCRMHDNGTGNAVALTNLTAYVIFDGLVFNSTNNSSAASSTGNPFYANNTDHITITNALARNPNKYNNAMPILFINSRDALVEDTEVYDYHRHCVEPFTSTRAVIRRVYCNPRIGAISGGYPPTNGLGRGDAGASLYPCKDCIVENLLVDGTSARGYLVEMNATGNSNIAMSGSKVLGSICYLCGGASNGIYPNARTAPGNIYSPTNITLSHNVIHGFTGAGAAIRATSNVNTTISNNTLLGTGTGNGFLGDDSANGAAVTSFTATKNIATGFSGAAPGGTGFTSTGYSSYTGTTNHSNGNRVAFSPSAATWGSGNVTTDPAMGTCIAWPPDGSAAATAGVGATILYRTVNGLLQDGTGGQPRTPLWDPTTGEFPHGAFVAGINDIAGQSAFDVHERLNINTNGCDFPAAFVAANGGGTPANPAGQVPSQGTTSPSHIRTVTASKEALTAGIALYDTGANVGTVTGVTSSCGSEALTEVGTAVGGDTRRRVYLFQKLTPTAGASCTIAATTTGTVTASVLISNEYDDVVAFGTAVTATGLSGTPSVTASVASDAGNLIVDMLASKCLPSGGVCTTSLSAAGTGQTLQGDQGHLTLGDLRGATSEKSSTDGGDVEYVTNLNYWALVAVPMCAVSCDALTHVLTQSTGRVANAFMSNCPSNCTVTFLGDANAASTDVPAGTSFAVYLQTDATIAAAPLAGRKLYVSYNSGAYVPVTDTTTNGLSFHGSTADPTVVSGAVSANLAGVLDNIAGTTIHSVNVTPSATMTLDSSLVNRWVLKLAADAVATDTYEFREYTDAGVALDAYGATADALVTVTGTTPDISAPTGLKLVSTSNTLVSLIWTPSTYATLAGYRVYQSTESGVYGDAITTITPATAALLNTTPTQWSVHTLVGDTYYFVVTAFDSDNNESAVSNEVTAVQTGMTARSASAGGAATARTAAGSRAIRGEQNP